VELQWETGYFEAALFKGEPIPRRFIASTAVLCLPEGGCRSSCPYVGSYQPTSTGISAFKIDDWVNVKLPAPSRRGRGLQERHYATMGGLVMLFFAVCRREQQKQVSVGKRARKWLPVDYYVLTAWSMPFHTYCMPDSIQNFMILAWWISRAILPKAV